MGFSVVSDYLSCPERARLRALGIRRKPRNGFGDEDFPDELNELGYGSLIHALLASRAVHGYEAALWYIDQSPMSAELHPGDRLKASTMLRTYEATYPAAEEPFEYIGVESPVATFMPGDPPVIRTARYDAVIRMKSDGSIFSLEHKTSARGGSVALTYKPQMVWQQALWNANPFLVETYGPMKGVIVDLLVKTQVPRCEREGPFYFTQAQEKLVSEYMRLPERIGPVLPVNMETGSHPRMLHSCVGKFRPCEYINICWESMFGDYEQIVKGHP